MKYVFVDADEIYWKGFSNIRLINWEKIFRKIHISLKPDKIFVYLNTMEEMEDTPYKAKKIHFLTPLINLISDLKKEMHIELWDGYDVTEERNLIDIKLINHIYKLVFTDESNENEYTIVSSSTKYFSTMDIIQSVTGKKVKCILSDEFENVDGKFDVIDTISLNPQKKTVFDKTTIREIIKIVRWGEEQSHYLSERNIIENCKTLSNISEERAEFILHALITNKLLEKRVLTNMSTNTQSKVLVVADNEKTDELLASL